MISYHIQVDILYCFQWTECRGLPVQVGGTIQAVWLKDKVYVGGGTTLRSTTSDARLYAYTPSTNTWITLDAVTPGVYYFAITTYHSQLVLVGGCKYASGKDTNELWTLSKDGQWQETLLPMPTPCGLGTSAMGHGDYLLVINDNNPISKVYVYNGHH